MRLPWINTRPCQMLELSSPAPNICCSVGWSGNKELDYARAYRLPAQNAAQAAPAAAPSGTQPAVLAAAQQAAATLTQNFAARPVVSGLGSVPAMPGMPGLPGAPPARPKAFRPAPLRLDEQGREINEHGQVVSRAAEPRQASTLKVPRRCCVCIAFMGCPSSKNVVRHCVAYVRLCLCLPRLYSFALLQGGSWIQLAAQQSGGGSLCTCSRPHRQFSEGLHF